MKTKRTVNGYQISTGTGATINELFDQIRGVSLYQGGAKYKAEKQSEVLGSSLEEVEGN